MSGGEEENLLDTGEILQTNSGNYRILRGLGGGATAEVFQAVSDDKRELMVAIKMMRPTQGVADRSAFRNEGLTLASMRSVEDKVNDGFFATPAYYGAGEKAGIPYFVMEFMHGKELPVLLEELGHLPEAEAVMIGFQLFRTLHLLHTNPKKTYIDLKFEDLWWERDKQVLKLTDWGTLEDVSEEGIARDIQRAGIYLFRLATGCRVTTQRGIIQQSVDEYPEWNGLSWGLQEILRRLLHRNPAVRIQDTILPLRNADEVAQSLHNLLISWQELPAGLLISTRRMIERAQSMSDRVDEQAIFYRNAKMALDVAGRKAGVDKQACQELTEKVNPETDYFERARSLYSGTSYAPARILFHQGAMLISSSQLRRWAWLAYAGETERAAQYVKVKTDAENAVALMEQKQFHVAREEFEKLLKELPAPGLKVLCDECRVFEMIDDAIQKQRLGNYQEAAEAYDRAYELWAGIPEHADWEYEIGKLQAQSLAMRTRIETEKFVARASKSKKLDEMLGFLAEALRKDPENKKAHELIEKLAGQLMAAGNPQEAARLLGVKGRVPNADEYAPGWYIPDLLRLALAHNGSPKGAGVVAGLAGEAESLPGKVARMLLEKHFLASQAAREPERATEIARLMNILAPETGTRMLGEIEKRKAEMVNMDNEQAGRLIAEAASLLQLEVREDMVDQPVSAIQERYQNLTGRVGRAREYLTNARLLIDPQDPQNNQEWHRLDALANDLEERFGKQHQESLARHQESLQDSQAEIEKFLTRLDLLTSAEKPLSSAELPDGIKKGMLEYKENLLVDALRRCQYILRIDPANEWAKEKENEINRRITQMGGDVWAAVTEKNQAALEKTLQEASMLLNKAEANYRGGDLNRAAENLRSIEPYVREPQLERFDGLKAQLAATLAFQNWQIQEKDRLEKTEFNPDLLRQINDQINLKVAPFYWNDFPILLYLTGTSNGMFEQLRQINPFGEATEFTAMLQKQVWVSSLERQAASLAKGSPVTPREQWNSDGFLRGLLKVHRSAQASPNNLLGFLGRLFKDDKSRVSWPQSLGKALADLSVLADPENQVHGIIPEEIEQFKREEAELKKRKEQERQKLIRGLGWAGAGVGVLVIVVALVFLGIRFGPQIAASFAKPIPSATQALLVTVAPTAAQPPTATAVPTAVPPTPVPTPEYAPLIDLTALKPAVQVPTYIKGVVLNLDAVTLPQDITWTDQKDESGQAVKETNAPGQAVWSMKQPLPPGVYAIYILDTKDNSTRTADFSVSAGGSQVPPILGKQIVTFASSTYGNPPPQSHDMWDFVGSYYVNTSSPLQVTDIWNNKDEANYPIVIDQLLIAQLPMVQPTFSDSMAVNLVPDGGGFSAGYQLVNALAQDVTVTWNVGALPKGKYQLLMWLPKLDTLSDTPLTYQWSVDSTSAPLNEKTSPPGAWLAIAPKTGSWTLAKDAPALTLTLTIPKDSVVAVDAIALVAVP